MGPRVAGVGRSHGDARVGVTPPAFIATARGLRTCVAVFPLSYPLVSAEPGSMGLVYQGGEMAVAGQHVPIDATLGLVGKV